MRSRGLQIRARSCDRYTRVTHAGDAAGGVGRGRRDVRVWIMLPLIPHFSPHFLPPSSSSAPASPRRPPPPTAGNGCGPGPRARRGGRGPRRSPQGWHRAAAGREPSQQAVHRGTGGGVIINVEMCSVD